MASGSPQAIAYDALGRTAAVTEGTTTTAYAFAGSGETVVAVTQGADTRSSLVDATGSRLAWTTGGATAFTLGATDDSPSGRTGASCAR